MSIVKENINFKLYTGLCLAYSGEKPFRMLSCLPMVGGSLRILQLLPPLKLIAMI
jgi:hypothetical protein